MKYKRLYQIAVYSLLLCFISIVPTNEVFAQQDQINLEVEFSPTLENAQVLSLTELGVDQNLNGPVLINGYIENLTGQTLENLYFRVKISASKWGVIVDLKQKLSNPFSLGLTPVYATNNDFANNRLPGIQEELHFTDGLTPTGDEFVNSLNDITTLPNDIYTVQVMIYQDVANRGYDSEPLASATAQLGAQASFEASEIYLKTPGDIVGVGAEITNPYPQFSWEGEPNAEYRVLVVESNGQDSPESLLQSAKSSGPLSEGGSLLQFENLDELVEGDSYQFPSSGVQPLEAGKTYYWRVITELQTGSGTEERSSEIWSFRLISTQSGVATIPTSQSFNEALAELLGEDRYNRIMNEGYTLETIEYDGVTLTGPAAVQEIERIVQEIRDGDIVLGSN